MLKTYVFEFMGTKEDFLNRLNVLFAHNITYSGIRYYYFSDYIIKIMDNEIHFGVERGGHSGGYWFIPTIAEFDDRIEFCGNIRYIGPEGNRGRISKAIDHIGEFLFFILLFPVLLIVKLFCRMDNKKNRQSPQTDSPNNGRAIGESNGNPFTLCKKTLDTINLR